MLYDEPNPPPHVTIALTTSTQGPSPNGNEMIVRSGETPTEESAATASAIPQTTASFLEEKGRSFGPLPPPESLNRSASDIPAPPRHSETKASTPLKNKVAKTPSSQLPEMSTNTNMLQPSADESQQCGSSDSITHDKHGYIICIP